jgi:hypothetical protein
VLFSREAFADGQAVWFWRSDAGVKLVKTLPRLRGDGGNQAWSPGRARSKPSNHRAGKAGCFRLSLWFLPRAFLSARGPRVSVDTRPSLRPLGIRRVLVFQSSGDNSRENAGARLAPGRGRIGLFDNCIRMHAIRLRGPAAPHETWLHLRAARGQGGPEAPVCDGPFGKMVPRGGIETSPIQLKVHHFLNGDFPVYLPVDPALSWRGREGATLCRYIQVVCVSRAIRKRSSAPCALR